MFHNCEGQSHKTVSTVHSFEENGEPKPIRTEVLLFTSLPPYRLARPAHKSLCVLAPVFVCFDKALWPASHLVRFA